jgi:hypothetical protein
VGARTSKMAIVSKLAVLQKIKQEKDAPFVEGSDRVSPVKIYDCSLTKYLLILPSFFSSLDNNIIMFYN